MKTADSAVIWSGTHRHSRGSPLAQDVLTPPIVVKEATWGNCDILCSTPQGLMCWWSGVEAQSRDLSGLRPGWPVARSARRDAWDAAGIPWRFFPRAVATRLADGCGRTRKDTLTGIETVGDERSTSCNEQQHMSGRTARRGGRTQHVRGEIRGSPPGLAG